ncbi:zinc metallopeptidase [Alphaproteobacteria bacterium]|nr:zinc metallopeptidase [Alphaproteobacteria bacterium]
MIKLIFYFLPFLSLFLPSIWVSYVLRKNNEILPDMPFTGKELGIKLLKENKLENILIEPINQVDHYNPLEKKVRISEDKLHKKSITSIAVVAHEIGHAIQDKENYKPLLLRQKLIEKTILFQRVGSFLLIIGLPSIFAITKSPFITFLAAILIMGCLSTNVVIHLITLPVEFDASFKRALPILQKYVPNENMRQCRSVLRAAAFTYLAQSIVSIFRLKVILFSFINILKSIIRR